MAVAMMRGLWVGAAPVAARDRAAGRCGQGGTSPRSSGRHDMDVEHIDANRAVYSKKAQRRLLLARSHFCWRPAQPAELTQSRNA
jgi:hypothetical protein